MALDIARNNKNVVVPDFFSTRNNIMLRALRAKFSQHSNLGNELKGTGNKQLIEHTFNDKYWGDGGDGSGQNWLGKLLMQVRTELQNGTLTYANPFRG